MWTRRSGRVSPESDVAKPNVRGAARRPVVLAAWVAFPLAAVAVCRAYEAVRVAAGEGGNAGRIANYAWYQLARSPDAAGAVDRLTRNAWYAAALLVTATVVLLSSKSDGRWATRIRA